MISRGGEVGKIGAEDIVNLSFPGIRIILIVEISLMRDSLGAFGFDQIQNRASIRPQSLIANTTANQHPLQHTHSQLVIPLCLHAISPSMVRTSAISWDIHFDQEVG